MRFMPIFRYYGIYPLYGKGISFEHVGHLNDGPSEVGITTRRRRLLKGRRVPPGPCWVLICAMKPVQAVARVISRMGPMAMVHTVDG